MTFRVFIGRDPRQPLAYNVLQLAKECLSYDVETGFFRWKTRNSRRISVGDVAGSKMSNGYINIRVGRNQVLAHRFAWAFVYGSMPSNFIDHINGDRSDNRICNLREAIKSQNGMNAIKPSHGLSSQYKGVHWAKDKNKWATQICLNGKRKLIGRYSNEDVAGAAYDWNAAMMFGEFAKTNGAVIIL